MTSVARETRFPAMTVLKLKRRVSRLSSRDLKELHAHVVRMRHNTPQWKKGTAKKLRAVATGRLVTAELLEKRIAGE